ncbi:hypothetical protein ACH4TV_24630 [Streptomyces sp. NPDC020898]|uniref:hypothetical protein n=1 Tax=Streptomyces sp. NPDC020898 TaxID=3365101 RepID=UPI00378D9202
MYGKCTRYRVEGIPAVKDRFFDALQDAKTWLAQAQTDARRGEFVDPRDGAISLKDYIATHWWPTQSGDPSTLERIEQRVRRHIVPHLDALPLNSVGTEALRGWKKRLEKDLGPTSIRLVWATLSGVLQAAVEDRRLARNPCRASTVRPPAAAPGRVEAWRPTVSWRSEQLCPSASASSSRSEPASDSDREKRSACPWRTSTSMRT